MTLPEPPLTPLTPPTLAYANSPARLTPRESCWAILPASAVLVAGVTLFLGVAWWLRLRYGPHAVTQWTANARQVEFWSCDVPLCGWLTLWALALGISLRRCRTHVGRHLAVLVAIVTLVWGVFSFIMIMEDPFP